MWILPVPKYQVLIFLSVPERSFGDHDVEKAKDAAYIAGRCFHSKGQIPPEDDTSDPGIRELAGS